MSDPIEHRGHCLCGAVRFRAAGVPRWVTTCHCDSCRRATGATMVTFAGFPVEDVTFEGTPLAWHESSPGVHRGFCPRCGSSMAYRGKDSPEYDMHVAVFDDPAAFVPTKHVHAGEMLPWVRLGDGLPRQA